VLSAVCSGIYGLAFVYRRSPALHSLPRRDLFSPGRSADAEGRGIRNGDRAAKAARRLAEPDSLRRSCRTITIRFGVLHASLSPLTPARGGLASSGNRKRSRSAALGRHAPADCRKRVTRILLPIRQFRINRLGGSRCARRAPHSTHRNSRKRGVL